MLANRLALLLASLPLVAHKVAAHAAIIEPWTRAPGDKSAEVCGQQWNDDRNGVANANTKMGQIAPDDLAGNKLPDGCNWRLCGGAQYEDNIDHVYTWEAGTEVPITVFALNRHGGVANVSVVDTATNEVIGSALKEWTDGKYLQYDFSNTCPNYPPLDEVQFNVTIPALGDKCTTGGSCVLQWYWYSEAANNQTFESCIDFVQPYDGSAAAASVTDSPSTTSWYRYCSPYSTTIDYWNASASLPLAVNTQYLNFATDVLTTTAATVSSAVSSAGSSLAAAVTGSSAAASSSGGASMASNTASSGSGAGSASLAAVTQTSSGSGGQGGAQSALVSTATSLQTAGAGASSTTPSALAAGVSSSVGGGGGSVDGSNTSSSSSSRAASSVAAAADTLVSATASASAGAGTSSSSKTACRARLSSSSSSSASSTALVVENAAAAAGEGQTTTTTSAACTIAEANTVTVTSTTTQTVYVELLAVGTSTAGVVRQTLAVTGPSASALGSTGERGGRGGTRKRTGGHGSLKRRSLH